MLLQYCCWYKDINSVRLVVYFTAPGEKSIEITKLGITDFRPVVKEAVEKYLQCGDLKEAFAREGALPRLWRGVPYNLIDSRN